MSRQIAEERWQRIWSLFDQAITQSETERASFLERACAGDAELQRTLEGLLRADSAEDEALDQPVLARPAIVNDRPATGSLGPYRLLRKIGQGGMGSAYLARRDDASFQRLVVVKLIRHGMESPDAARRLRTERQILASLDHPYIARLYDGGTTTEHLPYFVMEYIEGMTIDTFCDHNQLSVKERLDIFRKVCEAVHYAHQNLVVHRDLKPSNILVTADGDPKLLDFGIAKLLNPDLSVSEAEPTATWNRLLTPDFASPEQLRGQLITTASDVYSLGVLLYKLLVGGLPHRLSGRSPQDIERLLSASQPTRPSAAFSRIAKAGNELDPEQIAADRGTSPEPLRRLLAGDLDAIVLKALRTVPKQRYTSVEGLATDLERYQQGHPVLARLGSWSYRAGKLLRRHKVAFAAATTALALLAVFAVAMVRQFSQVAYERDRAQALRAVVLDLLKVNDPTVSVAARKEITVREALERSGPIMTRRLEGQPRLQGAFLHDLGTVHWHLGLYDQAREQLEQALAIRRGLFGEGHREVAESLSALGSVYKEEGDLDAAEKLAKEALEVARRNLPARDPGLAAFLNTQVTIQCHRGDYAAARPLAGEALEAARRLEEGDLELPIALNNLAAIQSNLGENRESASLYRQSVALMRTLWGEDSLHLAKPLNNLGMALRQLGELEAAEEKYREVLSLQNQHLPPTHPDRAFAHNNLAGTLLAQGQHAEARDHYQQARGVLFQAVGAKHRNILLLDVRIALTDIRDDEAAAAEPRLRDLLAEWSPELGPNHPLIALAESVLGEALMAQGRDLEAEAWITNSFRKLLANGKPRRQREALDRVVSLYRALGRPEEAEEYRTMFFHPS